MHPPCLPLERLHISAIKGILTIITDKQSSLLLLLFAVVLLFHVDRGDEGDAGAAGCW